MYCTNCGSEIRHGNSFCTVCGEGVSSQSIEAATDPFDELNIESTGYEQTSSSFDLLEQTENANSAFGLSSQTPIEDFTPRETHAPRPRFGGKRMIAAMASVAVAAIVVGSTIGVIAANQNAPTSNHEENAAAEMVNASAVQQQASITSRSDVESYSWDELATISDAIAVADSQEEALKIAKDFNLVNASGKLDGSQVKTVHLANGVDAQVQIVGFAHDARSDGGEAGITFMFKDCIGSHTLNSNGSNAGGWSNSELRNWMNTSLINELPKELRNSIISVSKVTNNAGKTSNRSAITSTYDKLWVPSLSELVGEINFGTYEQAYEPIPSSRRAEFQTYFDIWNAEGHQYKLFNDQGTRLAKSSSTLIKHAKAGSSCAWWGRSSSPGEWNKAQSVSAEGIVKKSTSTPSEELGVAPCFCISRQPADASTEQTNVYIDNPVTNVNPVEIRYVQVEEGAPRIDVVYIDKSRNIEESVNIDNSTNVNESTTVNNEVIDNSVHNEEPAEDNGDAEGGNAEGKDANDKENTEDDATNSKNSASPGKLAPESDQEEGDEDICIIETGTYVSITGTVEIQPGEDDDTCVLSLSKPIEVIDAGSDAENATVSTSYIELDSALSVYEGRLVTLRMALSIEPTDKTIENDSDHVRAGHDAQVIWIEGGDEVAHEFDDEDHEAPDSVDEEDEEWDVDYDEDLDDLNEDSGR